MDEDDKKETLPMNDFREYKASFDRKNSLMHKSIVRPIKTAVQKTLSEDFILLSMLSTLDKTDDISIRDYELLKEIRRNHGSEMDLATGKDKLTDKERSAIKKALLHYPGHLSADRRLRHE